MTVRTKTGGRKTGTPNKRTQDITALLDRLGCNPIEGMAPILSARAVLPRARLPLRPRLFVLAANSGFDPEP